ncbi:hypothetical protein GMORB2_1543 [Geosmithia morbida]|uniref:Rhodopsin domain-containing protein n=1 Tax=Geosmithia morbida TaxID=1094350 RepID=A0A9P4YTX0_9HYPO|nr:uncharacterized protein GMORB2_1543 [Geosmithia morbida]KAF4121704.1 hypothetical protein GMORB2_1543 [Geosmithia morbida]
MLEVRRPIGPDVSSIPTPPLQAFALFIIVFFTGLAFFVYCLRVYSRIRLHTWGIGTCFYLLLLSSYPAPIPDDIKLNYFGWKAKDVPEFDPQPGLWWFYMAQILYNPVLALVKASILVFLLRLVEQSTRVRWAIEFLNAFNALQCVAVFLVAIFQCLPVKANWDQTLRADPDTRCIGNSFHIISSSITLLTDIVIAALPVWIFMRLNMPWTTKMAAMGFFLLGIIVTVIGIVRLLNVVKLLYFPEEIGDRYHSIAITLNTVEVNVAIISASAPALHTLLRDCLPHCFAGDSSRRSQGNGAPVESKASFENQSDDTGSQPAPDHGNVGIHLDPVGRKFRQQLADVRSISSAGSEDGIMGHSGILCTTDIRIQYHNDQIHGSETKDGVASSMQESENKGCGG